jgi:phosphoglycerol transferase MdoB-like AlkP superfamily enzyme
MEIAWTLISVIILLILLFIIFLVNKKKKKRKFSKLTWFAFVFIFAGILFGDGKSTSYNLIGIGVILAVIDIIINSKKKKNAKHNK